MVPYEKRAYENHWFPLNKAGYEKPVFLGGRLGGVRLTIAMMEGKKLAKLSRSCLVAGLGGWMDMACLLLFLSVSCVFFEIEMGLLKKRKNHGKKKWKRWKFDLRMRKNKKHQPKAGSILPKIICFFLCLL